MPRIIRWFPVSHDINSDPEIWLMRQTISEKALSVWLEFLSIGDRNNGYLISQDTPLSQVRDVYQACLRSMSGKCQASVRTVLSVSDFAVSRMWLVSDPIPRIRNYTKYHKTREPNKTPQGIVLGSPPNLSEPTLPNLPEEEPPIVPQTTTASVQFEPAAAESEPPQKKGQQKGQQGAGSEQSEPAAAESEPPQKKRRNDYSEGFIQFCEVHPWGGESRAEAWEVWQKKELEPLTNEICLAVEAQRAWPLKARNGFEFFSRMPSYLRKERWKDTPQAVDLPTSPNDLEWKSRKVLEARNRRDEERNNGNPNGNPPSAFCSFDAISLLGTRHG